jgi:hypothetical protein
MVFDLSLVNLMGPVPAKLIEGFNHWKTSLTDTVLGGPVTPEPGFALDQLREILQMRGLFAGGLFGEVLVVLGNKGEL